MLKISRLVIRAGALMLAISGFSSAQTVIGSPGAGFQSWSAGNLNDNGAPYWDVPFGASQPNDEGSPAEKNPGFCLTSTGDCQGIGSALFAPGPLAFWGFAYASATDTGGGFDPQVYLMNGSNAKFKATLYLNSSSNPVEINEIGWFETNATGTVVGKKHILFEGTGPSENLTPAPVGSTVTFRPTQYFGYYYADVSEGNCYAYTLFNFNDPNCFGSHNFVVFTSGSTTQAPIANATRDATTMWIVGEDPSDCPNNDGDCNLTIIKVSPATN